MLRLHTQFVLLAIICMSGCNQNPFSTARNGSNWSRNVPEQSAKVTQLAELHRRNGNLDNNNSDLHRRIAQGEQEKQLLQKQLKKAQQLLDETTGNLESALAERDEIKQENAGLYASTKHRGGATIRANSSLSKNLDLAEIDFAEVTQDDGVVRIRIAADELFHPGTMEIQQGAPDILADVAAAIRRNYPQQIITIEAHTDNSTRRVGNTMHQLAASQALRIHEELVVENRLPERQFVVTGFGDIAPIVSNATPAGRNKNRRIDLVVHPESFGK